MGNNSSKYDRHSDYANKSVKKIQAELTSFTASYDKISSADYAGISTPFGFLSEHIAFLKLQIAERIGRK